METGFYHPDGGYWEPNDVLTDEILDSYPAGTQRVPKRPSADHSWDGSRWIYIPRDEAVMRAEWREGATLSKSDFCLAIAKLGLVSPSEAVLAAQGGWPESFSNALSDMPQDAQVASQILWAGCTEVKRTNLLLRELQEFANVPDETLDTMFGWT